MTKNKFNIGDTVVQQCPDHYLVITSIRTDGNNSLIYKTEKQSRDEADYQDYSESEIRLVTSQEEAAVETPQTTSDISEADRLLLGRWWYCACNSQIWGIRVDSDGDCVCLYLRNCIDEHHRKRAIIKKIFGTEDMSKWSIVLDYILKKIKIKLL